MCVIVHAQESVCSVRRCNKRVNDSERQRVLCFCAFHLVNTAVFTILQYISQATRTQTNACSPPRGLKSQLSLDKGGCGSNWLWPYPTTPACCFVWLKTALLRDIYLSAIFASVVLICVRVCVRMHRHMCTCHILAWFGLWCHCRCLSSMSRWRHVHAEWCERDFRFYMLLY